MRDRYDIVIIGAGPGGLTAAAELAESGATVAVFESADEIGPKVCAGALPSYISEFDIPHDIIDREISDIILHTAGRNYELSCPAPFLYIADRGRLGRFLLARAEAKGAVVFRAARVRALTSDRVVVNGQEIGFRYLIGADGSNSIVRKVLGLPKRKLGTTLQYVIPRTYESFELFFDVRRFGSGLAWIVPHKDYTIVGMGRDLREARGRNLREDCRRWCREQGFDLTGGKEQAWPINYDFRGWCFGHVFLIGDAAGFASGLTGEGIYAAMVSGREAARRIINPATKGTDIDRLLRKKRSHERLLAVMQGNLPVLGTFHRILLYSTRYGRLAQKYVEYFF